MKKLFFLAVIASTTLISCLNKGENPIALQPIDQLKAYVDDDTDFSFSVVDSTEYKEVKLFDQPTSTRGAVPAAVSGVQLAGVQIGVARYFNKFQYFFILFICDMFIIYHKWF